ncbi:MAG: helix-turn-helix domain-containing protein [Christensenellales bacterium]|jgi:AraC-like DNA-binding protein
MKKNTLMLKLFLTYALVLILPLLAVTVALSDRLLYSYQEQMRQRMHSALQSIDDMNNTWHSFIEHISIVIALDKQTGVLGTATDQIERIFEGISYMSRLSSYRMTYRIIDSIYVYNEENNTIYTSLRTQFSADDFRDKQWLDMAGSATQWIGVRTAPVIHSVADTTAVYHTYVRRISASTMGINGYIVINVCTNQLLSLLIDNQNLDALHILDENNMVISSTDNKLLETVYDDQVGILSTKSYDEGGSNVLLAYDQDHSQVFVGAFKTQYSIGSQKAYQYIGVMNSESYLSNIYAIRTFIILTAIGCLLLGIPLCYLLSKKMYNPIKQILESFNKQSHSEQEELAEAVRIALHNVVNKNSWLASFRKDEKKNLSGIFDAILPGKSDIAPVSGGDADALSYYQPYPYIVLLVSVDEPYFNKKSEHMQPYLHQILSELFLSILGDSEHKIYAASTGEHTVALAVPIGEQDRPAVKKMIDDVKRMLKMVFEDSVSFAVSLVKTDMHNVSDAYAEAEKAMRQKFVRGAGSVIFYDEEMERGGAFYYPRNRINQALTALDMKDDSHLETAFEELFSTLINSCGDIDDILTIYYQLVSKFIQRMIIKNIKPEDVFTGEQAAIYKYMANFEIASNLNLWVKDMFMILKNYECSYTALKSKYLNELAVYVHENYKKDLIPVDVAAALGISYSYLRRLLNAELQINFVDYVNAIRIQHAKMLLADKNILIKDVARMSGFTNEQSFNRAFKKSEGMAPGMYRKNVLNVSMV